ncbi:MAG: GMP synthase (glutamine-hydrolyzing), partial [Schleiferiaceae bacterium]|nr:GMP synthase (glutamine-hydrolyzing) [Schleiferiaceae bacterium]
MQETILILDFGSQYTQLIARRVRELNVYCEIHPFNNPPEITEDVKGVILSGSPYSTLQEDAPQFNLSQMKGNLPLLGVCYGAQYMALIGGGKVAPSKIREYGRANLSEVSTNTLFKGVPVGSQVWMSHGDTITELPQG